MDTYYINSSWDSQSVGWKLRNANTNWNTLGAVGNGTDLVLNEKVSTENLTNSGRQVRTIELSPSIIQNWTKNSSSNNGLLLSSRNPSSHFSIHGSEDEDITTRPILRIYYQFNTPSVNYLEKIDEEPRGVHCRFGGQAINTGFDYDQNHTLDSDEISNTEYKCDEHPVFYVSPNGFNSYTSWDDGTIHKPWATINFAIKIVPDGATIIVRPGTYVGRIDLAPIFDNAIVNKKGITIKSEIPYMAKLRNDAMVVKAFYGGGYVLEGFDIAHCGNDADYHLIHIMDNVDAVGPMKTVSNFIIKNNILHDSYKGDLLKISNGAENVVIENNMFYNQTGKQLHLNTVKNVIIQDNVFFNDFASSNREISDTSSSYISIMSSLMDTEDQISEHISIKRNVFMNWQGLYGMNFITLGGDGLPFYEASDVLIENNLLLGESSIDIRSPIGIKGAKDVLIRNNTWSGNTSGDAFMARINTEESNPLNDNIFFYNNILSDETGTMDRLSRTPFGEMETYAMVSNLYWNNSEDIPFSGSDILNIDEDTEAVIANPVLQSPSNAKTPYFDSSTNLFGATTTDIRSAFLNIVSEFCSIPFESGARGAGIKDYSSVEDIFGFERASFDIGAFEYGANNLIAIQYDISDLDFSLAGWLAQFADLYDNEYVKDAQPFDPTQPTEEVEHLEGQLFAPGNIWNQDISQSMLDSESSNVISWLSERGWGGGSFRIDFGIDVLKADENTPFLQFIQTEDFYSPDCDYAQMPVPANGNLEAEKGYECTTDGDCHLIVIDEINGKDYEMWRANITSDGQFFGGCLAVWDLNREYSPSGRGEQCSSADGGGLPIAGLVFTADEIAAGSINHAIRFILPNDRIRSLTYVHPATHSTYATTGSKDAPPYGARLRLRADYPVSSLPTEGARVVARALQKYGMILTDGGTIALTAQSDRHTQNKWAGLLGSHDLTKLAVSDFEMVDGGKRYLYDGDCVRNK